MNIEKMALIHELKGKWGYMCTKISFKKNSISYICTYYEMSSKCSNWSMGVN